MKMIDIDDIEGSLREHRSREGLLISARQRTLTMARATATLFATTDLRPEDFMKVRLEPTTVTVRDSWFSKKRTEDRIRRIESPLAHGWELKAGFIGHNAVVRAMQFVPRHLILEPSGGLVTVDGEATGGHYARRAIGSYNPADYSSTRPQLPPYPMDYPIMRRRPFGMSIDERIDAETSIQDLLSDKAEHLGLDLDAIRTAR